MPEQIHVGDIGIDFEVTVLEDGSGKDLSSASTITMKFRDPNNGIFSKAAAFVSSGIDGKVHYETEAGLLHMKGQWDLQVVITFPGGDVWHTDIVNFHVHPNI
jgi:hypothetical protein